MPGQDADSPKAETESSDITQEQSETNPPVQPSQVMPENEETSTVSETVIPEHPDTTQTPQTEATEITVNKDTSPDGKTSADVKETKAANADAGTPSDSAQPASSNGGDPPSSAAAGPADGTADGTGECYRYEDDVCIYTDPSSGVEYVYSSERDGWVRRDGSGDGQPLHAPTLENCYYVGEHYCFRDAAGTVYRLDPESNSWQEWSGGGADAEGGGGGAEGGADTSADNGGAAPADGDGRCFRSADGAWCCRDDSGALCRWDADAGRWQRADTTTTATAAASSSPMRRAGPTSRKRRLNRGSSDDSEHDSDEDDAGPAKKRAPYVATRLTDGDGQAEHEGPPDAGDNDGPSDGSGYEWDPERGAWFPKIDEEFLALHRLNYGFDSEGRAVETAPILDAAPPPSEAPPQEKQEAGKQRKLNTKKKPEWFQLDDSKNTKVYVSGLPEDVTEDEFVELMSKCGLVMKDPMQKNAWKIKLYRDDYGVPKGDAICTYIKIESVNLALDILDGYEFKGKTLTVEKATFDMKGKFDPSKKPKKKNLKKKDREKLQKKQEKLFAWQPDKIRGERERHERVVILKNLFSPEEFKTRPEALLEYQQDLREECGKFGTVKKVVVHDRHADGVAEVIFQEAIDADSCVLKMNGRWFAGRQLQAATWDGKTKYRVEETEEERAERLAKWEQFITGEEKTAEDKPSGDTPAEGKSAEDETAEDKAAGDTTMEDKPAEDKPSEDKSAESAPSDEAPPEDVPMSDATPAEDKTVEDAPDEDTPA